MTRQEKTLLSSSRKWFCSFEENQLLVESSLVRRHHVTSPCVSLHRQQQACLLSERRTGCAVSVRTKLTATHHLFQTRLFQKVINEVCVSPEGEAQHSPLSTPKEKNSSLRPPEAENERKVTKQDSEQLTSCLKVGTRIVGASSWPPARSFSQGEKAIT